MLKIPQSLQNLRAHAGRAGWAVSDAFIGPLILLLLSPFLLHHLGVAGFGLWALATAISGFGSLASMGVGIATTKYVSEDLGAGNLPSALSVTRSASTVAMLGGLALIVIVGLTAPLLARFAFGKMGDPGTVSEALTLGVLLLVIQEIDGVFAGALRGSQRFDAVGKIEMTMRPSWAIAVALTAWSTQDTVLALYASVAVNALKAAAKAVWASRVLQGFCARPSFDVPQFKRVFRFGKWAWLQGLGIVFFSVIDRILVGALLGAADLARYSICLQLTQVVHVMLSSGLLPLIPAVSGGRQDGERLKKLKRLSVLGGLACLIPPLLVAMLSSTILSLWVNPAFAAENQALVLGLFVSATLLCFFVPVHHILIGLGEMRLIGVLAIVGGLANLAVALVFSGIGVGAFAIGRIVFAVLPMLFFIRLWQIARSKQLADDARAADEAPAASRA